ncbi:MAG: hypothetical protein DRR08_18220 [Candidatus Parabeggiatoa sp. nov. 2]|nr:MAG: hypothetical protein DRR08_18220 [Gammaproteobacteria bacterium]
MYKKPIIILLSMAGFFLGGCSERFNRAAYNTLQYSHCPETEAVPNCMYENRQQCWQNEPVADCEIYPDYDTYQAERKRVLEDER